MRIYFLVIIGYCFASNVFSQNVVVIRKNTPIPIYTNVVDDTVKYSVMQDSINELFFDVKILENSPLRFKVNMRLMAPFLTPELGPNWPPELIGWIDKIQCGVFKRLYCDENNNRYIKLYSEPNSSSEFIKIYELDKAPNSQLWTVVDYRPNHWMKVVFYFNNILYEGWVDKYCSDVYDSCS